MLNGVFDFGISFSGCLFDKLKGLTLCGSNGFRMSVFGTMRDDLFPKTVGEIETMSIRRDNARILLELFV